jgi:hypothetical protein
MRISEQNGRLVVGGRPRNNRLSAQLAIVTADPALAARIAGAIAALPPLTAPLYPRVILRTREVRALQPGELAGKIAVLHVRGACSRAKLAGLLALVRAATPLGIQMVLDDRKPGVERARAAVFAALEEARGKGGCPLALARTQRPAFALRLSILRSLPEKESPC